MANKIKPGTLHKIPEDLRAVLVTNEHLLSVWNNLTPLMRNEWVCWITIVKKQETRKQHLQRLQEDLLKSKKRPCCWPGCPHHRPKAQKWFQKAR